MSIMKEIRTLPTASILAFYNPKKKKVYLTVAKNTFKRLSDVVYQLRNKSFKIDEMVEDYDDLELIILETNESRDSSVVDQTLKLHMNYWQKYVEEKGLTHYGKKRNYIEFKSRLTQGVNHDGEQVIFCNLVNKRNESIVVGVFPTFSHARQFERMYIETQKRQGYIYPIYSCNELTRKYMTYKKSKLTTMFNIRI